MKPFVLAVALTGLLSVTALAGNIPTNDVAAPGEIPTNDFVSQPSSTSSQPATSSSGALASLVLTIITLINR